MEEIKQKNRVVMLIVGLLLVGAIFFGWKKFGGSNKNVIQMNDESPAVVEENNTIAENEPVEKSETAPQATVVPKTQPINEPEKVAPETNTTTMPGIKKRLISWGFQKTDGRKIDSIIIHSSYDAIGSDPYSVSGILEEYKQYGVSAHYLMDRQGQIYQLVEDKNIAYHAGVAKLPDGRTNVNEVSIGIEMMNTKDDKFTATQYDSLNIFLAFLKGEYKIKYVLGHNQVAPGRKDDPWNFDWSRVAK